MYLKQILRSLARDPFNTIVIIVSLIIGIASFSLILVFINYELGTDDFQKDKNRIYALNCDDPWMPGKKMYYCRAGSAEYMKKNFSSVEDYCRVNNSNPLKIIVNNNSYFDYPQIIGASPNFFSFFSYELLTKNPETVLEAKNCIVISSDLAEKYFDSDPVGKVITLVNRGNSEDMTVTGIFRKNAANTQLNFDMVRPIGDTDSRCYIKLSQGSDPKQLEKIFQENKESIPVVHAGKPGAYYIIPLKNAYFDTIRATVIDKSRDKKDLWIATIVGLLIIWIAVFNYLGILANKFQRKTREFFIRRINGSPVSDLVNRFLLENSFMLFLAFIFAIFLLQDILPFFNSMTGSSITGDFIFLPGPLIVFAVFIVILLLITFIFTLYLVRSNSNLYSLKADYEYKIKGIQIPFFNIFQIAASITLIICSLVIIKQIKYITDKPIGLDKSVIEVKIPAQYSKQAGVFKQELLKYGSISNVSVTGASPLLEHMILGLSYQQDGVEKEYFPSGFNGDENYLDVLNIKLLDGTGFKGHSSEGKICIVNQAFARLFSDRPLVGQGMPGLEENIITGIVEDFHYSDLRSKVEPAFVSCSNSGGHLLVKATEGNDPEARKIIAEVWKKLIPDFPVNTETVGERFEWYHRDNANLRKLLVSCSFISLFLSVIGLLAITYQKARSRTKEIGIRKINGASYPDILFLINKGFLAWTVIAFLLAVPVSWYAMHKWLEGFAYKADLSWWIFLIAGAMSLIVILLTINGQIWSVARRNPVDSLRYE